MTAHSRRLIRSIIQHGQSLAWWNVTMLILRPFGPGIESGLENGPANHSKPYFLGKYLLTFR